MWGGSGPGPDPGGTKGGDGSTGTSNQELIELKDQFEQQQVLIAQLKEMLRKTEKTSVTQEKVEEYANTLTRMSARVKEKRKKQGDQADEAPASEKIMLLRQQLEENKLRLAQRGKFQKGIEETVTQLKAQLDDSQQLISQTPLNLSLSEGKTDYSIETSPEELYNLLVTKDKKLTELNSKIQRLEGNVLDLQENVKEKDSVIDARTKAITLMTESLSKKGKNTLDALDDTKEQMRKMQENFVSLEMDMKLEKQELLNTLEQKNILISELQIDNARLEQNVEMYQSKLASDSGQNPLIELNAHIEEKNKEIEGLKQKYSTLEADFLKLSKSESVEPELETLRNRVVELESLLKMEGSPRDSPQRQKRGKKGQKVKTKDDLQKIIDNLKDDCEKYKITIMEHELMIKDLNATITELQIVKEPVCETEDVVKLKKQIDESNKNMIKIKAQHKSKVKELNKKLEEFKKGSDGHDRSMEYEAEINKLKKQIESLDKSKEELLSKLTEDAANAERVKELEAQLFEQSELLDTKNQSLDCLETQLKSYKTELQSLSERFNKLSHLENDQVASEMTSIHFEEQLDGLELEKNALIELNKLLTLEKESLLEKLDALLKEKQEMSTKLDNYMQENMDLIDKLEKLSAEKVSSAESIEIVESLTQQEKLELEAYQQSLELASGSLNENLEPNPELNESVNQLTEETSDLLRKIELFTEERKEVMEKMEVLTTENNHLNMKIQEIENNLDVLSETYEQLQNEKEAVEQDRNTLKLLEQDLNNEINQLKKENEILKHEIKHGSENDQSISFETVMPLETEDLKNIELQKQIDEYRSLVEIQKSEIKELKEELLSYKDLPAANRELHEKITLLQEQYEIIKLENDNLSKIVKENGDIVQEKHIIETELITARKRIEEFNDKLTENIEELDNYKTIIEENKEELITSSNIIADLQEKVHDKENEIWNYQNEVSHLNSVIAELNSALSHLDSENQRNSEFSNTIEVMSSQLQDLKILLNENISQIQIYQNELQQNSDTISKLNTELKELNNKLLDMEHELECKDDELRKLVKERDNKELMISNLQSQLEDKEKHFHGVCETLNEKYVLLQKQIEQNAGSLSNIKDPSSRIEALELKNKEQFEKMKKIAANLKKKSAAHSELEQKNKDLNEKLDYEQNANIYLKGMIDAHEEKIQSQSKLLQESEAKLNHLQVAVSQKSNEQNNEIMNLKQTIDELQSSNHQLEAQLNTLRTTTEMHNSDESNRLNIEINEKNEIIENLNRLLETIQYQAETNSNALEAKIREMEMVVENQEIEINKYKDQIDKLEEFISTVEERRLSLEKKAVELNAQLVEKSNSYEEISQAEDMLEQRLAALMVHDEQIEKRLNNSNIENQELIERNQHLLDENDKLKHHLSAATEKNLESSFNLETLNHLQNDVSQLNEVINRLESENKHLQDDYERKLKEKVKDIEILELEQQNQVEQIAGERKMLIIQCEQKDDQVREYAEKQSLLMEEIRQLKDKLDQQQVDFEEQMVEFERLNEENKNNLRTIEKMNTEFLELKKKIQELEGLLITSNENVEKQKNEMIEVMNKLQHYTQVNSELTQRNSDLVNKVETMEQQLTEQKLTEPEKLQPISTFIWSDDTSDDPFDFIKKNVVEPVIEETTEVPLQSGNKESNEDLQLKIKSLEFMLYNTEKEKEDVLAQCQKLTSEIAHLIYDQQNFERQSDDNRKVCHKCQCTIEDMGLSQQIVSQQDTEVTKTDLEELHNIEFETTKQCVDMTDSKLPITEDVVQCKSAYLCYPSSLIEEDNEESVVNLDAFDENDDGWGCGADEAKLEDDYRQQVTHSGLNRNLNLHIEELDEKVRALEIERDRHLEEIKQLQIKSGKLIKKLKEYKSTNDKLSADLKKLDFMGLDDTIQDELKSRIAHLEKRVKETNTDLQKEKTEKNNLLQKVNALQASHDRMTETKEKQNVDVMVLQRQNHELTLKLEQFEWGKEGFDSPVRVKQETEQQESSVPDTKILELNDIIKELTLDNEELQTMLEEQRTLRIDAEKSKSMQPVENMKTETEYLEIVAERNSLNDQLLLSVEDKKRTQEELNNLIKLKTELEISFDRLKEEKACAEMQLAQISISLESFQRERQEEQIACSVELEESKQKIMELSNQVISLKHSYEELQSNNLRLNEIDSNFKLVSEEKNELWKELEEKKAQLDHLKVSLTESEERKLELETIRQQSLVLAEENKALREQLRQHEVALLEKSKQLEDMDLERATYTTSLQQLADEWSQRVDQRGIDVSESWKLHLEAQESEFSQTQNRLQKEINDLEEKCNALVNENNELRRNVDAEIKNEVDKISALQQQITSRQHYINELTLSLQEYQTKLNKQELQLSEYQNSSLKIKEEIQQKDDNIVVLNELVNDLKTNLNEKVEEIAELSEKLKSFDDVQDRLSREVQLRSNLEDEMKASHNIHEHNEKLVLEIQSKHSDLVQVKEKLSELMEEKEIQSSFLEKQVNDLKVQLEEKLVSIEFLNDQLNTHNSFVDEKDNELLRLSAVVEEYQRQAVDETEKYRKIDDLLHMKDAQLSELTHEFNNIKILLNEKEKEYHQQLELLMQQYLQKETGFKSHYDKLLRAKDAELESINAQLSEQVYGNEALSNILNEQESTIKQTKSELISAQQECDTLKQKLIEEETLNGEENKQISELSHIIEDQVLKIEGLKQELFEKSKDYDSLIAELDLRKPALHLQQQELIYQARQRNLSNTVEDSNLHSVSRAELDLAHYMLHQRDVRCEELTVELMQLLEERDTLQLKLSNEIREKEALRRKFALELMQESASDELDTSTIPNKSMVGETTFSEVNETTPLANKLSELKSVGYKRDKTLLDEQDQRRLLQLTLMQEHRDVASMLPPEAAARLVQEASYTLSRDVQSPSKVLLNWLWGKSTPKVNDI